MDTSDLSEQVSETATHFEEFAVSALRTTPNRTIFTEDDNDDAWISTDLTVDLRR